MTVKVQPEGEFGYRANLRLKRGCTTVQLRNHAFWNSNLVFFFLVPKFKRTEVDSLILALFSIIDTCVAKLSDAEKTQQTWQTFYALAQLMAQQAAQNKST